MTVICNFTKQVQNIGFVTTKTGPVFSSVSVKQAQAQPKDVNDPLYAISKQHTRLTFLIGVLSRYARLPEEHVLKEARSQYVSFVKHIACCRLQEKYDHMF